MESMESSRFGGSRNQGGGGGAGWDNPNYAGIDSSA